MFQAQVHILQMLMSLINRLLNSVLVPQIDMISLELKKLPSNLDQETITQQTLTLKQMLLNGYLVPRTKDLNLEEKVVLALANMTPSQKRNLANHQNIKSELQRDSTSPQRKELSTSQVQATTHLT